VKVVALLNLGAGAVEHASNQSLRARLAADFAGQNVEAEIVFVSRDRLRAAAKDAAVRAGRGEVDAIVAGGGDGSIGLVAGALAGTTIPLGVLPLGTLNHFAKDLEIPLDLDEAVETIAKGRRRRIDLAEVNGNVFINNASIGIYSYLVSDRERLRREHPMSKWLAMLPALLHTLEHFPHMMLSVEAGGVRRIFRTPCVFIGNNEYAMELASLGRRKRLDGGELWLYVVKPQTPLGFLWTIVHLCLGRLEPSRDIERFNAKDVTIKSEETHLPVALDGDVSSLHPPLHVRSLPGALQVIVPDIRG
jgi:diacylglycerol kinase family enzyme